LRLLRSERDQAKGAVQDADDNLQIALNVVDEKDEDATDNDREQVCIIIY
jgi:hypothetical protein